MITSKAKISNISSSVDIVKINDDAVFYALNEVIQHNIKNNLFIHVVQNNTRINQIYNQIKFFNPTLEILTFPSWDCRPFDKSSPKSQISYERIKTLSYLRNYSDAKNKTLIITTIESLIQKTIPQKYISKGSFSLNIGDEISLDKLINILSENGYQRSSNAENIGEFAVRGSIIDIILQDYQTNKETGYRIDFFGDNIDSIRLFDPLTQMSCEKVKDLQFLQSKEVVLNENSISNFKHNYRNSFGINNNDQIYEGIISGRYMTGIEHFMPLFYNEELDSFFDYLNDYQCQISLENNCENQKISLLTEIKESYQARIDNKKESLASGNIYNPVHYKKLYLDQDELEKKLEKNIVIRFDNFENQYYQRPIDLGIKTIPNFLIAGKSNKQNPFELMKDFINSYLKKHRIIIACNSTGSCARLNKILLNHEIASELISNLQDINNIGKNIIGLIEIPIKSGFYDNSLAIVSENSLLGDKKTTKPSNKIKTSLINESIGLNIGDLVVHRYHGIGRFEGLKNIEAANIINDFIKISYFGGDNLFLPVEDINLVSRYGDENQLVQLDKLGSPNWKNRSEKIRKRIKIAAEKLIKIAALRQSKNSAILTAPVAEYEEFKAKFKFIETPDQIKAIEEVEEDLKKGLPMDRLICGDVGFGKTEVAMRCAFIAAKNETKQYQVAIITPTTLLSRQHYNNFIERFEGTNLVVKQLSRMVSPSESRQIKQELELGKIDIIVGTHSLLNKNIKFKNLGLVIIDEEQHFGVAQKERLKELKNEVHILSLSATPIPRTLQMSLSGVKDLSIIATPPIDRIAIRSFVMDYDPIIIKEAIMREFHRGGKIFFVVPRIKDLEEIQPKLEKMLPDVKIKTAHGKMTATKMDEVMNDFYNGKFQLLLATTIIESGIDIKDANTIIIYKSHMFGLSQLYQLRGRVGRGKIKAYAYITTPPQRKLSEASQKKLQVMQTIDSLGAGFNIASHDMDIRGSGNILSDEQSGHIKETGVELYQNMLNEAILELKETDKNTISTKIAEFQSQIKLKISLLIPEDYILELGTRLNFYKRIGQITSISDKEDLIVEMVDRFGKMPEAVNNLIEIAYIKYLSQKCNIEKIEAKKDGIIITFKDNYFENPDKLLEMVFSSKNQIQLKDHRLFFARKLQYSAEKLKFSLEIVNKILNLLK